MPHYSASIEKPVSETYIGCDDVIYPRTTHYHGDESTFGGFFAMDSPFRTNWDRRNVPEKNHHRSNVWIGDEYREDVNDIVPNIEINIQMIFYPTSPRQILSIRMPYLPKGHSVEEILQRMRKNAQNIKQKKDC